MTCAPQAEVWLKCRQLNREQNFSIDAHEFIRFQSELSVENDKCVITARDQTDYQIKEIALKFLSGSTCFLSSSNYFSFLDAARYAAPLRKCAEDYLVKKMLASITPEELEEIVRAYNEFQLHALRPFILCALLHVDDQLLDETDVDDELKELAKDIKNKARLENKLNREDARFEVLTKIYKVQSEILGLQNRHAPLPDTNLNLAISKLVGFVEVIHTFYSQYLKCGSSLLDVLFTDEEYQNWKEVGNQLTKALQCCTRMNESAIDDPEIDQFIKSFELMRDHYIALTELEKSTFSFLKLDQADQCLEEFGTRLSSTISLAKRLQNGHVGRLSENAARKTIRHQEELLIAHTTAVDSIMHELEKPEGFSNSAFILFDGIEIGVMDNQNVLWISKESFDPEASEFIQTICVVLDIDRLAVGSKVYPDKPMLAFFQQAAL